MRNRIVFALAALLPAAPASAHVMVTPQSAPPASRTDVHFRVGHGCSGSPTIALTVEIPGTVSGVTPQVPGGWSLATVRAGSRVSAVTWKGGEIAAGKPGEFVVTMMLPAATGTLAFPATQICKNGQERWTDLPGADGRPGAHPVPVMTVGAPAAAKTATATLRDGWFRALPAAVPSGAYFTLHNSGSGAITLTGAQSPACGMLMLHRSENQGGMGSMDAVTAVDVPAGKDLAFAPGGYHLMCMQAKLTPGTRAPVTLQFKDGSRLTADFAVRNAAGR